MNVIVQVTSAEEIAAARTAAEAQLQEGDTLEVVVVAPVPRPAATQSARPARGFRSQD